MTNQQSVLDAQARAASLKEAYMAYLTPLAIANHDHSTPITTKQFVECQRLGNTYFNALEDFVSNSGLLGAHMNGKWVTNLAESCHAALVTYVAHNTFLRSHAETLKNVVVKHDKHAMAGMQRMVKEYLSKDTFTALFEMFRTEDLPTQGFTVAAHDDVKAIPAWQLILCMILGAVLLAGCAVMSLYHPYPSPFQTLVFRGIFALGLSAMISGVPGFIDLKIKITGLNSYLKLVAGGAVAIFVLAWFFNPPELGTQNTPSAPSIDQSATPDATAK